MTSEYEQREIDEICRAVQRARETEASLRRILKSDSRITPRVRTLAFDSWGHWSRAFAGLVSLLVLALLCLAPVARAQSNVDRLLRTSWSECSTDCSAEEIAALHDVIVGIAERADVSFARAWALASPRLAAGTVSRSWLAHLDHRCEEPRGWPAYVYERDGDVVRRRPHPPWAAFVERCEILVVNVRWVLDGVVPSPCRERPRSWGSTSDAARPFPGLTFVRVDCGSDLHNVFGEWRHDG
jgi:hypothetical protein